MVAPIFDYDPRRIKQFVNALRLNAYIFITIGLVPELGIVSDAGKISLEQLGKFVALMLSWPELSGELTDDAEFLARLDERARSGPTESRDAIDEWLSKHGIKALLLVAEDDFLPLRTPNLSDATFLA